MMCDQISPRFVSRPGLRYPILWLVTTLAISAPIWGQVAGRGHRLGRIADLDSTAQVAVQILPETEEQVSFVWDAASGEGLLAVPTLTPPGDYQVRLSWRRPDGLARSATVPLRVEAPPPLKMDGGTPVILLNGFQFSDNFMDLILYGACPVSRSTPPSRSTFGELEPLLAAQGTQVLFFDNCVECRNGSIEDCGQALGRFIQRYPTDTGQPVEQVDLVGHSMGGLIARSYLAGKKPEGGFEPPDPHRVRKLAFLGTPHFGSYLAVNLPFVSAKLPEMVPGSNFLWELATWNEGRDDLRGVDALALAGSACAYGILPQGADGLVTLMSASLNFAREPERTRVLPYRHTDSTAPGCPSAPPLAFVDGPDHLAARALLSFLQDTGEWRAIGASAAEDFVLLRYGAGLASLPGVARMISGAGVEWRLGPNPNPANVFFADLLTSEPTDLWFNVAGVWARIDGLIPTGTTAVFSVKPPQ
jgi:pimeloyl-ACP methyl ester carboxylesterase